MTHVHLHQTRFPSIFVCPAVFVKTATTICFHSPLQRRKQRGRFCEEFLRKVKYFCNRKINTLLTQKATRDSKTTNPRPKPSKQIDKHTGRQIK